LLYNIAYIHARPHGHPLHERYAKSINPTTYHYIDFLIRWHDIRTTRIKRYLSWILCAIFFPSKKKYRIFYSDGMVHFLIIMKVFRLIKPSEQKLVSLQGDETLYFLNKDRYSSLARILLKFSLRQYDALICIGKQQSIMASKLVSNKTKIYTIYNGIELKKIENYKMIVPNLQSNKLLFIANIDSEQRAYYKGLDFLLKVFELIYIKNHDIELNIIGRISSKIENNYLDKYTTESRKKITFLGPIDNLYPLLNQYCLYLHFSRGEVWGLSIAEAACAGIPVLVSNETGIKEVWEFSDNKHQYETSLTESVAADKVSEYLSKSMSDKIKMSDELRNLFIKYTEEKATINFKNIFSEVISNLS
jgi:glycosyltransferase involved in cell wall biosynthesis